MEQMSFSPAVQALADGYRATKADSLEHSTLFQSLVRDGQHPKILLIGCCDSRVDPALITAANLGDMLMVRNVANLVPANTEATRQQATSAALEFAVLVLQVTDVIILGHSQCGGIKALMQQDETLNASSGLIQHWMDHARAAKAKVLASDSGASASEQATACEKASLLLSLDNLLTFPWIAERVAAKQLRLHGWYFELESATIKAYQPETDTFVSLD